MEIKSVSVSDLKSDPSNARTHSQRNLSAITESLKQFGQRKPIVVWRDTVLAGNGTLEAAKKLKWDEITIAEVPAEWDENKAKAYALADNRSSELADWNELELVKQLAELESEGWDIEALGFDMPNLEVEDVYTKTVNIPQYDITGEMPTVAELYNPEKSLELQAKIDSSGAPDEIKDFLRIAAFRHTVFNYQKIAEFYAHADSETQELIEQSALVIIDYEEAIRNGYVELSEAINDLRETNG